MKTIITILTLTFFFDLYGQTFIFYQPESSGFNANVITDLHEGSNGKIICYSRGDSILTTLDNGTWNYIGRSSNGFSNDNSAPIEFDIAPNGDIWLAHFSTIDVFNGTTVTNMTTANSELQNDFIKGLAINNDGTIVIGYNNGFGISIYDGNTWKHKGDFTGSIADLNSIFTPGQIHADRLNGDFWITSSSKLYQLSGTTLTTHNLSTLITGTSFNSNDFSAMTVADNGNVYFSYLSNSNDPNSGGIVEYDGTNWTHLNTTNSNLPSNKVRAMTNYGNRLVFTDSNTAIYLLETDGTLTTFDQNNTNFPSSPSFTYANEALSIGSFIYFATNAGLLVLEMPYPSEITESNSSSTFIYPNPASNQVRIESDLSIQSISIYDIMSKLTYATSNVGAKTHLVDVSKLKNGTYLIQIEDQNGNFTQERIVIHK